MVEIEERNSEDESEDLVKLVDWLTTVHNTLVNSAIGFVEGSNEKLVSVDAEAFKAVLDALRDTTSNIAESIGMVFIEDTGEER